MRKLLTATALFALLTACIPKAKYDEALQQGAYCNTELAACKARGDDLTQQLQGRDARIRELQQELRTIFAGRTSAEWIAFGNEHNTPIAPVNTPKTIADDPQFRARFQWLPAEHHGADMLPFPVKYRGEELPTPRRAPTVGEQSDAVLERVLGYDAERIQKLREGGALG